MNNEEIHTILDRYWEATVALDLERVHEYYHDDVVVEFPQSGERIRGKHNIYELRKHYPTKTSYKILRTRGEANFWVTELIVTYEDERPVNGVAIMEFRNGKVAHETLYFAYPFEPPEWRSQWVERIQCSSPSLMPELQRNTGLVLEIIEVERSLQADSYRNISTSSTPYW